MVYYLFYPLSPSIAKPIDKKREEIREGDIGADLRIDLKSFVEISDGSFPTSLRIHCHRSVNFFNNSLIRMFLSYPLLSQHRDEAGKRTIETGEIRVGKAMVVDKRPAANSP